MKNLLKLLKVSIEAILTTLTLFVGATFIYICYLLATL